LLLVAESTGGRRNRIDTLLVRRVEESTGEAVEESREPSGNGATRYEEPARVEG
jgi:hypothetical protein